MEFKVSREQVYSLADVLGMTLTFEQDGRKLTGEQVREVRFDGVTLPIKMKLVSSQLSGEVYMIMVKSTGNLGLFVTSKWVKSLFVVEMHIIDLAKLKGKLENWLETNAPASVNAALVALGHAVVRSFVKEEKDAWTETEVAA